MTSEREDRHRERGVYPETAASMFDPVLRKSRQESWLFTCRMMDLVNKKKAAEPRRVHGHETD